MILKILKVGFLTIFLLFFLTGCDYPSIKKISLKFNPELKNYQKVKGESARQEDIKLVFNSRLYQNFFSHQDGCRPAEPPAEISRPIISESREVLRVGAEQQYQDISSAISAASPGDLIIVAPGRYRENLTIAKPLALKGEGRPILAGSAYQPGIRIEADQVFFEGFEVTGCRHGVYLDNVSETKVVDNIFSGNYGAAGVVIGSKNCVFYGNVFKKSLKTKQPSTVSNWSGLVFRNSSNNVAAANSLMDNWQAGIFLEGGSRNNLIIGNAVKENSQQGIFLTEASDCNTFWQNTVQENIQSNFFSEASEKNLVLKNVFSASQQGSGLWLKKSSAGLFFENSCDENFLDNVRLEENSRDNFFGGNSFSRSQTGRGMVFRASGGNQIQANEIKDNQDINVVNFQCQNFFQDNQFSGGLMKSNIVEVD